MYVRHTYREDIAGPAWLYRLFAGQTLAYVGVSSNPRARFTKHRYSKPWWSTVTRVEFRWHPSRESAFAAERAAIAHENPLHNVARPKVVAH